MTFRSPHSPFVFNEVVGKVEYDKLKKMAEECEFGYGEDSAGGTMDVGIENTPPYSREKRDKIDAFFMKFIQYNGLNTIFKINDQVSRSHDSFILKYEESKKYGQALTGHRDGGKQHVLSIIFTININTYGGGIILSNRDDGFLQQNNN
jgi:hypothetical protein